MRKVHIISIAEPVVFDLALAICDKGYEVSASGSLLPEGEYARLKEAGITFRGDGWFPEVLTKDIHFVVLGALVRPDNPELVKAKELGLLVMSLPEFVFQRTKSKTRVVVSGTHGKKSIIAMIVHTLKQQRMNFDYALSSDISSLPNKVGLSYAARVAIIEGDEHVTSVFEKRFQLEFYRPHIAVICNIEWLHSADHSSLEEYITTYRNFAASIEREGKLIYFGENSVVSELAAGVREDITAVPYEAHTVIEEDGQWMLNTRYGNFPIYVPDSYFLINLNAARLACRHLGIKDADFYKAISDYSLMLNV